jgi:hypothetical protein
VQTNSLYLLYYLPATEFPLRPIVTDQVKSQTIVTYSFGYEAKVCLLTLALALLMIV